jgi:hypothetical protein
MTFRPYARRNKRPFAEPVTRGHCALGTTRPSANSFIHPQRQPCPNGAPHQLVQPGDQLRPAAELLAAYQVAPRRHSAVAPAG